MSRNKRKKQLLKPAPLNDFPVEHLRKISTTYISSITDSSILDQKFSPLFKELNETIEKNQPKIKKVFQNYIPPITIKDLNKDVLIPLRAKIELLQNLHKYLQLRAQNLTEDQKPKWDRFAKDIFPQLKIAISALEKISKQHNAEEFKTSLNKILSITHLLKTETLLIKDLFILANPDAGLGKNFHLDIHKLHHALKKECQKTHMLLPNENKKQRALEELGLPLHLKFFNKINQLSRKAISAELYREQFVTQITNEVIISKKQKAEIIGNAIIFLMQHYTYSVQTLESTPSLTSNDLAEYEKQILKEKISDIKSLIKKTLNITGSSFTPEVVAKNLEKYMQAHGDSVHKAKFSQENLKTQFLKASLTGESKTITSQYRLYSAVLSELNVFDFFSIKLKNKILNLYKKNKAKNDEHSEFIIQLHTHIEQKEEINNLKSENKNIKHTVREVQKNTINKALQLFEHYRLLHSETQNSKKNKSLSTALEPIEYLIAETLNISAQDKRFLKAKRKRKLDAFFMEQFKQKDIYVPAYNSITRLASSITLAIRQAAKRGFSAKACSVLNSLNKHFSNNQAITKELIDAECETHDIKDATEKEKIEKFCNHWNKQREQIIDEHRKNFSKNLNKMVNHPWLMIIFYNAIPWSLFPVIGPFIRSKIVDTKYYQLFRLLTVMGKKELAKSLLNFLNKDDKTITAYRKLRIIFEILKENIELIDNLRFKTPEAKVEFKRLYQKTCNQISEEIGLPDCITDRSLKLIDHEDNVRKIEFPDVLSPRKHTSAAKQQYRAKKARWRGLAKILSLLIAATLASIAYYGAPSAIALLAHITGAGFLIATGPAGWIVLATQIIFTAASFFASYIWYKRASQKTAVDLFVIGKMTENMTKKQAALYKILRTCALSLSLGLTAFTIKTFLGIGFMLLISQAFPPLGIALAAIAFVVMAAGLYAVFSNTVIAFMLDEPKKRIKAFFKSIYVDEYYHYRTTAQKAQHIIRCTIQTLLLPVSLILLALEVALSMDAYSKSLSAGLHSVLRLSTSLAGNIAFGVVWISASIMETLFAGEGIFYLSKRIGKSIVNLFTLKAFRNIASAIKDYFDPARTKLEISNIDEHSFIQQKRAEIAVMESKKNILSLTNLGPSTTKRLLNAEISKIKKIILKEYEYEHKPGPAITTVLELHNYNADGMQTASAALPYLNKVHSLVLDNIPNDALNSVLYNIYNISVEKRAPVRPKHLLTQSTIRNVTLKQIGTECINNYLYSASHRLEYADGTQKFTHQIENLKIDSPFLNAGNPITSELIPPANSGHSLKTLHLANIDNPACFADDFSLADKTIKNLILENIGAAAIPKILNDFNNSRIENLILKNIDVNAANSIKSVLRPDSLRKIVIADSTPEVSAIFANATDMPKVKTQNKESKIKTFFKELFYDPYYRLVPFFQWLFRKGAYGTVLLNGIASGLGLEMDGESFIRNVDLVVSLESGDTLGVWGTTAGIAGVYAPNLMAAQENLMPIHGSMSSDEHIYEHRNQTKSSLHKHCEQHAAKHSDELIMDDWRIPAPEKPSVSDKFCSFFSKNTIKNQTNLYSRLLKEEIDVETDDVSVGLLSTRS